MSGCARTGDIEGRHSAVRLIQLKLSGEGSAVVKTPLHIKLYNSGVRR